MQTLHTQQLHLQKSVQGSTMVVEAENNRSNTRYMAFYSGTLHSQPMLG